MARKLRSLASGSADKTLVEVMCRTVHSRFLLTPSSRLNQIVLGVLAKAQERYGVDLHYGAFLSSHYHLLLSAIKVRQLSGFMQYVNSNLARKIGRLYDWDERFWGRRYSSAIVSEEPEAQIGRLLYLLEQGCKEGLVFSPLEWPGVHTAQFQARGYWRISTAWRNETAACRARRRGELTDGRAGRRFEEAVELVLVPLPCWKGISRAEASEKFRELVREIERVTKIRHRQAGTKPLGREAVAKQRPHERAKLQKRSLGCPNFHAFSGEVLAQMRQAYAAFVTAYRAAAERLRRGELEAYFPEDSFPPPFPVLARSRSSP